MNDLRYRGIHKRFGRRDILDGVDLDLRSGQCQLLCGRNGAGKSTLLRILAGMERPDQASVVIEGKILRWRQVRRRLLADCIYLHQTPYLFEGSVRHNLNYPLSGPRQQRERRIQQGLDWSGLGALAGQDVHKLSGGERQRVALARAWLRGPRVMLLDEPTANMDLACRQRTVELLKALRNEGVAMVVATHDALHFSGLADGVLQLSDGRLAQSASAFTGLPGKVTPIDRKARVAG
jgi:tungstate transport system ATP-binding protein